MRRLTTAVTFGLLALALPAQEATDWAATLEKAQKHRRMRIRIAAANKVAKAGDVAIAAIRAYETKHGRNAIRMDLVVAFTRAKKTEPKTCSNATPAASEALPGYSGMHKVIQSARPAATIASSSAPDVEAGRTRDAAGSVMISTSCSARSAAAIRIPASTMTRWTICFDSKWR